MRNTIYRYLFLFTCFGILSTWVLQIDFFQSNLISVGSSIALIAWEGYCIYVAMTGPGVIRSRTARILIIINFTGAFCFMVFVVAFLDRREWNLSCRDCQGAAIIVAIYELGKFAATLAQACLQIQPVIQLSRSSSTAKMSEMP